MKINCNSVFMLLSTTNKNFSPAIFICAAILILPFVTFAQDLELKLKIKPDSPELVCIEGRILRNNVVQPDKSLSFAQSFAGAENLGERIFDLSLFDKQTQAAGYKKLAAGEFLAESAANAWSYKVNARLSPDINRTAHVSWIKNEQGILMLGDLLPQFFAENNQPVSARIKFELPAEWEIITSEKSSGENIFAVENVEKAIFFIGKNWRERQIAGEGISLNLAISGEWQFSDAEAATMTAEIFAEYRKLFGEIPGGKTQIALVHFPHGVKSGRWEAETRGANLMIVSGDMPFRTQSLQRLHEQLRHEIFHLWIPNRLALTGSYDWFYEGFTVYQALRTGAATNQIRFEDFLGTLADAYNFDNAKARKVSLIESSKNRWNDTVGEVYARGMIVAFLCDIALLRQSKGKRSISNIFQEIYQRHRKPNEPEDGNAAITRVLKNFPELQTIVEKYVVGAENINWASDLESVGIKVSEANSAAKLVVKAKLNGKQKDLLNELGYNNWRKISEK